MAKKSQYRSNIARRKNRKGLSSVVTTVLLIGLGVVAAGLVWMFVNSFLKKQIDTQSCYGNFDKITINGEYTCSNKTVSGTYNLRFSLSVADIDLERAVVSVSSASAVKSYEITNTSRAVAGLTMYPSGSATVSLPGKNSGLTYEATGFSSKIDSVKVAAYIGGNMCDTSDSVSEIVDCNLLF